MLMHQSAPINRRKGIVGETVAHGVLEVFGILDALMYFLNFAMSERRRVRDLLDLEPCKPEFDVRVMRLLRRGNFRGFERYANLGEKFGNDPTLSLGFPGD
jgi:hypothetical protein